MLKESPNLVSEGQKYGRAKEIEGAVRGVGREPGKGRAVATKL